MRWVVCLDAGVITDTMHWKALLGAVAFFLAVRRGAMLDPKR